jgi:hypothetical protein
MSKLPAINLVLSIRRDWSDVGDLREVLRRVREIDPRIHTHLLKDRPHRLRRAMLALRPTLVVGIGPLKHLKPLRGSLAMGIHYTKAEEYRRLDQHSLPVPEWTLESEIDAERLARLGPYVVRKPNLGGRGHEVVIKKASRIRPAPAPAEERDDRIVQRFVYTGRWPSDYRVLTCFGKCLLCYRSDADRERAPLEGPEDFRSAGGRSIVAGGRGCILSLRDEKDVIELGERAHRAFPEIPLLGIDIAREERTGKLFILEVNAVGKVWEFRSQHLERMENAIGARLDEQFDGLGLAAQQLAREARLRAR